MRSTLALALLLIPASASATPNFPPLLEEYIPMPAKPECSVCHAGDVTTTGTLATPFGSALRMRGAVRDNEEAMKIAIDALRAEGTDSDSDGIGDIAELETGGDPNVPETDPAEPVAYGCGNQVAAGPSLSGTGLFGLLGALIAWRSRRRS